MTSSLDPAWNLRKWELGTGHWDNAGVDYWHFNHSIGLITRDSLVEYGCQYIYAVAPLNTRVLSVPHN